MQDEWTGDVACPAHRSRRKYGGERHIFWLETLMSRSRDPISNLILFSSVYVLPMCTALHRPFHFSSTGAVTEILMLYIAWVQTVI